MEPTRVCVFSYARCGVRTPMNKSVRTKKGGRETYAIDVRTVGEL